MKISVCLLAACGLSACAATSEARATTPMGRTVLAEGELPPWRRSCREEGAAPVTLRYRDAPGGAAVEYTTTGDPAYLRERVTEVARYHNSGVPSTAMHDLADVPHTATVQEIEGGALLTLFTSDRIHMEELRIQVQRDVQIMRRHGCGRGQEAL